MLSLDSSCDGERGTGVPRSYVVPHRNARQLNATPQVGDAGDMLGVSARRDCLTHRVTVLLTA